MNYKQAIIESFDSYITDNQLENTILKSKRKGEYYIAHDYWISLMHSHIEKWKTAYWIDMSICFMWWYKMEFLSYDFAMSLDDYEINRFEIPINNTISALTIKSRIFEVSNTFIRWDKNNTLEKIHKCYLNSLYKEYMGEWFTYNYNKSMLNYLTNNIEKGRYYLTKCFQIAHRDSEKMEIEPFKQIIENDSKIVEMIKNICENNIDRYMHGEL
ncbi:MAG: hypothetical protein J6F30_02020 [Cellulosilyticum sp.]|nr:hypothetical protein [Cellulosilyticum sp.]